jgi:hypothetical protein
VIIDVAGTIEEGRRILATKRDYYELLIVDLLWVPMGEVEGQQAEAARGLELVEYASKTPGLAIVAVSVGDAQHYPMLLEDAKEAGADVASYRGAIQGASHGRGKYGWDAFAAEIVQAIHRHRGKNEEAGLTTQSGASRTPVAADSCFVVHGRDQKLNESFFTFLRALGLLPKEFDQVVNDSAVRSASGNPNVFDAICDGFAESFGAIVLFSPDEEVRLRAALRTPTERGWAKQPRPNVLIEAGYALRHNPGRTVLVRIGESRAASDLAGMHIQTLDNSEGSRGAFAERLRAVGFAVRTDGQHWRTAGTLEPTS